MKQHLEAREAFFSGCEPLIASVITISPSKAATLAFSDGKFNFTNFTQEPENVQTSFGTNAVTDGKGGTVRALANANANFQVKNSTAENFSNSTAFGESNDYQGLAESQTSVIGDFEIQAGSLFGFDFKGILDLRTEIDESPKESAIAIGDIAFVLLDTTNLGRESI